MSNPAHPPQELERFVVRVEPPVRPLVIAAVGSMTGAVMLVVGLVRDTGWLSTIGVVVMILAVGLALVAMTMRPRYRTTLIADRTTLTLVNGPSRRVLRWTEIADVRLDGARLIFSTKGSAHPRVVLIDPRQTEQPMFAAMLRTLRARLDASRGYGAQ